MFRQRSSSSHSAADLRLRLRCWAAVAIMFLASLGQALHAHGQPGSLGGSPHHIMSADSNADTCPLCVAMHSAAPAPAALVLHPRNTAKIALLTAEARVALRPIAHWFYSRPPPFSSR